MRSENSPIDQETNRTFTETARRAQIVAAAIDTIAELGYGQASLARIAETAGTSKGVILYHFGGKDELIRELVAELVARGVAYMSPGSRPSRPVRASCAPTSSPTWPSCARTAATWSRSSRSRSTPARPTAAGMSTVAVRAAGLTKRYGVVRALDGLDLDLEVGVGEVHAFRDRIVAYASFEPGPEDRPADSI